VSASDADAGDAPSAADVPPAEAGEPAAMPPADDPAPTNTADKHPAAARPTALDPAIALGQATFVMMASPVHKHLFLTDLEWLLLPPIAANQYRIFRANNRPVGLATWALLTEESEDRLKAGQRRLRPSDWTDGDRFWLIDLVAPLGGVDRMAAELRNGPFKDRKVKTLQPAPDGKGVAVVEW